MSSFLTCDSRLTTKTRDAFEVCKARGLSMAMDILNLDTVGAAITTCEMHTGGEPLRILEIGGPKLVGNTILEKRKDFRRNHDHIRKALMREPRGHYDMYGAARVAPDCDGADVAFLFMHNEGYSTMCGHAVIALGRYCLDTGIVQPKEPETLVNIQCPCGLVPVYVSYKNGKSGSVRFHSVPSFVFCTGLKVFIPELDRSITVDVAYGGSFYVFVSAQELGIDISFESPKKKATEMGQAITNAAKNTGYHMLRSGRGHFSQITKVIVADEKTGYSLLLTNKVVPALSPGCQGYKGRRIVKKDIGHFRFPERGVQLEHPDSEDLAFLYGTIIVDTSTLESDGLIRQMTVFADCELDRSPTGSGTSAHVALLVAGDRMKMNQTVEFESAVTKSRFSARAINEVPSGRFDAVTVEVSGSAYYTGKNVYVTEADDPFKTGFVVK